MDGAGVSKPSKATIRAIFTTMGLVTVYSTRLSWLIELISNQFALPSTHKCVRIKEGQQWMKAGGYLCAGQEIGISLDPGDDLTQDDAVGEHICLQTGE